jgi:uncharacterized membrane protein
VVRRNVRTIADLEDAARKQRSASDRVADAITRAAGHPAFAYAHVVVYGTWIAVNLLPIAALRFDPYPFGLLTMVGSTEALFLTTFILISQNRAARIADRRHHLDLQISMLAEQEVTKMLEMVEAIHARTCGPVRDADVEALKEATHPERVVEHIEHYVEETPPSRGGSPAAAGRERPRSAGGAASDAEHEPGGARTAAEDDADDGGEAAPRV